MDKPHRRLIQFFNPAPIKMINNAHVYMSEDEDGLEISKKTLSLVFHKK